MSFLLMAAQSCEIGPQAETVATDSADRIRLGRLPDMTCRELLGPGVDFMDCAFAYPRRAIKKGLATLALIWRKVGSASVMPLGLPFSAYAPSVRASRQASCRHMRHQ